MERSPKKVELNSKIVQQAKARAERYENMTIEERITELHRGRIKDTIRDQIEARIRAGKRVRARDIFLPSAETVLMDQLVEGLDNGTVTMPPDLEADLRRIANID